MKIVSIHSNLDGYLAATEIQVGELFEDVEGRGETLSEALQDLADSLKERDL